MTQTLLSRTPAVSAGDIRALNAFARRLAGNATRGDTYTLATLEAVAAHPRLLASASAPRVALYAVFDTLWRTAGARLDDPETPPLAPAAAIEARLLQAAENFTSAEIAEIMALPRTEIAALCPPETGAGNDAPPGPDAPDLWRRALCG